MPPSVSFLFLVVNGGFLVSLANILYNNKKTDAQASVLCKLKEETFSIYFCCIAIAWKYFVPIGINRTLTF